MFTYLHSGNRSLYERAVLLFCMDSNISDSDLVLVFFCNVRSTIILCKVIKLQHIMMINGNVYEDK